MSQDTNQINHIKSSFLFISCCSLILITHIKKYYILSYLYYD